MIALWMTEGEMQDELDGVELPAEVPGIRRNRIAQDWFDLKKENEKLHHQLEQMRAALEIYADGANWDTQSDDGSEPDLWVGFGEGPSAAQKVLNT